MPPPADGRVNTQLGLLFEPHPLVLRCKCVQIPVVFFVAFYAEFGQVTAVVAVNYFIVSLAPSYPDTKCSNAELQPTRGHGVSYAQTGVARHPRLLTTIIPDAANHHAPLSAALAR